MNHELLIINNPTLPPLKSDVSVGLRTVASELRGGARRGYEEIIKEILIRAAQSVHCPKNAAVAVIFVSDVKMRQLNRKYRGKDQTTNVLAFPTDAIGYSLLAIRKSNRKYRIANSRSIDLGDIFISLPEARREAKKYGWTMQYAVARLALHGFLHLLGYTHRSMAHIERKVLAHYAQR